MTWLRIEINDDTHITNYFTGPSHINIPHHSQLDYCLEKRPVDTQAIGYPALTAMGRTGRKWRPLKEKPVADEWPDGWGDGMEDLGQYSSCGIRVTHLLTSEGRQWSTKASLLSPSGGSKHRTASQSAKKLYSQDSP